MTTESTPRAGTAAAAADDHERFQLHDRLEILGLVRTLVERRALVSVVYGGGSGFFVSALLQVSSASGEIIVDGAPDLPAHAAALASSRLTFATLLDNIRVQFHADGAEDAEFEGQRALRIALPDSVLRLQRRADYRLRIPPAETPVCELRIDASAMLPLRVYDISCGGIALVDWPDGRAPENHRLYRQCRLLLDDEEPLAADLEVVYVLERTESDGQRVRRCGARFVDLPGTLATRVQRYITRLERRQKALRDAQGGDRR
ncbi:MAG: flagellar brake protein [Betaproteobacteria bacterium]|nr:flagellar brake protein [Betaproteobacteria bacterium]